MSLFKPQANGNQPQMTPQKALSQLQTDPAGTLKQAGLNIPDGMNNPQEIVQHLLQSGQVTHGRFAQAMQMMGQLWRR